MKVSIELQLRHENLLRRWASVGRTFDSLELGLTLARWENEEVEERALFALKELQALHRALEELHTAYRSALWEVEYDWDSAQKTNATLY